jgi:hypothetical protein
LEAGELAGHVRWQQVRAGRQQLAELDEDAAGLLQRPAQAVREAVPPSCGGGLPHVVGAALQQLDAQLALQALQRLAQGGLHDVLAFGRPAKMQLLGQGHEVAQLAKLDGGGTSSPASRRPSRHAAADRTDATGTAGDDGGLAVG